MGRIYSALIHATSVDTARTLLYLTAPADGVLKIINAEVAAADDDVNEQMDIGFQRVNALGTPTATALTPTPHSVGDAAFGGTAAGNVTASEPTYLANTEIGRMGASSLGGWQYRPADDERPEVSPSATLGLRLITAQDTAKDLQVVVVFEEIGG